MQKYLLSNLHFESRSHSSQFDISNGKGLPAAFYAESKSRRATSDTKKRAICKPNSNKKFELMREMRESL